MIEVSVIICTYNPDAQIFQRVLQALQNQTLSKERWELVIVDNNSSYPLDDLLQINWHPHVIRILEESPGLIYARLSGFRSCHLGTLIVFVDDDNVLFADYLENALLFHELHPEVGCYGGRSIPVYETAPPPWFGEVGIDLGCQDFGQSLYISDYRATHFRIAEYPLYAPIGTGMVLKYEAYLVYVRTLSDKRLAFGRKGTDLTSGEDNDMVLTVIKNGFEIAYVPLLTLTHIIPKKRYSPAYLSEMAFKSNLSWNRLLCLHGINPRPVIAAWTVPLRQARAWIKLRAWQSQANYIKWRGTCGVFRGLTSSSNE